MINRKEIRAMVLISLFIAMQVVLTRFFSITFAEIVRIGFTFLPLAFCSIMFGPVKSGIAAALADVIGMILFPQGAYFFGFTLSAFLSGAVYGLCLYKRPVNVVNIGIAAVIVCVFINTALGTLWLSILLNKGFLAILPARVATAAAMIPIQIIMIKALWEYAMKSLTARYV